MLGFATQDGLGKTLMALMLIVSNPAPLGWAKEGPEYAVAQTHTSRAAMGQVEAPVPIKTTVVIAFASEIESWKLEVATHVVPHGLRW